MLTPEKTWWFSDQSLVILVRVLKNGFPASSSSKPGKKNVLYCVVFIIMCREEKWCFVQVGLPHCSLEMRPTSWAHNWPLCVKGSLLGPGVVRNLGVHCASSSPLPFYLPRIHISEEFLDRMAWILSRRHLSKASFAPEETLGKMFWTPNPRLYIQELLGSMDPRQIYWQCSKVLTQADLGLRNPHQTCLKQFFHPTFVILTGVFK